MKVLMVEPGKTPYEAELDGLKAMQAAVGGMIEGYYPYSEPVVIVCNDEGKLSGLPLNREIYNEEGDRVEIIAGTFFVAGLGEDSFADLPNDLMAKYKELFKYPEKFVRLAGEVIAVKQSLPQEEKTQEKVAKANLDTNTIRLDKSMDLAFDLDTFFRQSSDSYTDLHPDSHEEKVNLADELLSGRTSKIRMGLAGICQEEHLENEAKPLWDRILAYEKEYGISTYSIYQLSRSDDTDHLRFMSYDWVKDKGFSIECSNYQMVYAAERVKGVTLEDIFTRFNIDHPKDFKGHSLSVSDVVVLHEKGQDTAYYVDSFGFQKLPEFMEAIKQTEAKQSQSIKEQLDGAKKQASKIEVKTPDKKKEPERS